MQGQKISLFHKIRKLRSRKAARTTYVYLLMSCDRTCGLVPTTDASCVNMACHGALSKAIRRLGFNFLILEQFFSSYMWFE